MIYCVLHSYVLSYVYKYLSNRLRTYLCLSHAKVPRYLCIRVSNDEVRGRCGHTIHTLLTMSTCPSKHRQRKARPNKRLTVFVRSVKKQSCRMCLHLNSSPCPREACFIHNLSFVDHSSPEEPLLVIHPPCQKASSASVAKRRIAPNRGVQLDTATEVESKRVEGLGLEVEIGMYRGVPQLMARSWSSSVVVVVVELIVCRQC